MPSSRKPSASAILFLLLHSASFASSQTTVSPNYASESPSIYQEYNFTYPTYATDQTILTSYKDSIDVSWTSIAPHHPPSLSIECWIRNATTSPICMYSLTTFRLSEPSLIGLPMADASRRPDYGSSNLITFALANESSYLLELATFQEYSPCQLILQDFDIFNASNGSSFPKNNNNPVFSNIFAISVQNHSAGVTWSAKSPAPEQTGTDGIGGGTSKSVAGNIRAGVSMAYAGLVGAMVVTLMLWAKVLVAKGGERHLRKSRYLPRTTWETEQGVRMPCDKVHS